MYIFFAYHSKFSEKSFINFASLDDGILITDGNIPEKIQKKLNEED